MRIITTLAIFFFGVILFERIGLLDLLTNTKLPWLTGLLFGMLWMHLSQSLARKIEG